MALLFCYGSNNPEQLAERLGRKNLKLDMAFTKGYRRVYRGWSKRWKGGVATLLKKKDALCFGLVCEVDSRDIKVMDMYEGGHQNAYKRQKITVYVGEDFEPMEAIAYFAISKEKNSPSTAYLKAIYKTVSYFWKVKSYKDFYNED